MRVAAIFSYWTLGVAFLLTPCGQSQAGEPKRNETQAPFQLVSGFLIEFKGDLGSLNALKFILDTGVTHSVVDQKLAQKLGVHSRPKRIFAFDRQVRVEEGSFADVMFGPVHLTHVSMLVGNLKEFSTFANGADAIIGSDLLSLTNFTIDYDKKTLIFQPLERSPSLRQPHAVGLFLQLQLQGHPIELLLDTGIDGIVLFSDRLFKQIPNLLIQDSLEGVTVGRWSQATLASLPAMYLGSKAIEGKVYLLQGPPANAAPGIVGYLGTSSLKPHRIECDIANNSFKWR